MGELQPYRVSARRVPAVARMPRSVIAGLSFGTYALAAAIALWIVNRGLNVLDGCGPDAVHVLPIYSFTIDVAFLGTGLLCALRPVPGTRVRLAAIVLVASVVLSFGGAVPWQTSPTIGVHCTDGAPIAVDLLWTASVVACAASWGALAWLALECRRWRGATWPFLLSGALASSMAAEQLQRRGLILHDLSWLELLSLGSLFGCFVLATFEARRRTSLEERALDPAWRARWASLPAIDVFPDEWRATSRSLRALFFAVAAAAVKTVLTLPICRVRWDHHATSYVEIAVAVALALAFQRARGPHALNGHATPLVVGAAICAGLAAIAPFQPSVDDRGAAFAFGASAAALLFVGLHLPPVLAGSRWLVVNAAVCVGLAALGLSDMPLAVTRLAPLAALGLMSVVLWRVTAIDRRLARQTVLRAALDEDGTRPVTLR